MAILARVQNRQHEIPLPVIEQHEYRPIPVYTDSYSPINYSPVEYRKDIISIYRLRCLAYGVKQTLLSLVPYALMVMTLLLCLSWVVVLHVSKYGSL